MKNALFVTPHAIGGFNHFVMPIERGENRAVLVQGSRRDDTVTGLTLVLEEFVNKRTDFAHIVVYVGTTPTAVKQILLILKGLKVDPKRIWFLVTDRTSTAIGHYLLDAFPGSRHLNCDEPGNEDMGHLVDYFLDHGKLPPR